MTSRNGEFLLIMSNKNGTLDEVGGYGRVMERVENETLQNSLILDVLFHSRQIQRNAMK